MEVPLKNVMVVKEAADAAATETLNVLEKIKTFELW